MARGGPLRPQPPALPHLPAAGDMFRPPTPPRAARGSHAPGRPRPRSPKATSPKSPRPRPDRMHATDPSTTSRGDSNIHRITTATTKTPMKVTMTPRINQYLMLEYFRQRDYLSNRGKASGTIFLRGGIHALSEASVTQAARTVRWKDKDYSD